MERKCDDDTHNVLLLGVYGHLKIAHTLRISYINMPNMNFIPHAIFEILCGKEV